jgi:hypothetical protein
VQRVHLLRLCVHPQGCIARHIVASLTCWPLTSAHQAQFSRTVASGAAVARRINVARHAGNGTRRDRPRLLLGDQVLHRFGADSETTGGRLHRLTWGHRSQDAFA